MPDVGKDSMRADVICPYYKDHNLRREARVKWGESQPRSEGLLYVKCEGFSRGSNVRVCFRTKESLKSYMERACCKDWQKCPYARAAGVKWKPKKKD